MRAAPADTQHNSSAALAVDLSNNSISNRRPDKFTADIKRQHRHAINARRHRPSLSQIIEAARVYTVPVVVRPCCRVPRVEVDRLQCRSPLRIAYLDGTSRILHPVAGQASTATLTCMLITKCCLFSLHTYMALYKSTFTFTLP